MVKKELPKLSDSEIEIMKAIWSRGTTTILEVLGIVNQGRREKLKRTTIQVQMTRLEEKGWIEHTEENRTYLYRATRGIEETSGTIVKDIADRVFDGSCSQLVKALFNNTKVKKEEIEELRNLLKSYEGGGQ